MLNSLNKYQHTFQSSSLCLSAVVSLTRPHYLWGTWEKKTKKTTKTGWVLMKRKRWCEWAWKHGEEENKNVCACVCVYQWAVSSTLCPESPKSEPGPAESWAWPPLDQLDSSFLVLFHSAFAHRRWGLGSSLRKDLQLGRGSEKEQRRRRTRTGVGGGQWGGDSLVFTAVD